SVIAASATADPTERSTWRATSSSVNGAATMPTTTVLRTMFRRLLEERKNSFAIEKKAQTAMSATIRAVVGVSTARRKRIARKVDAAAAAGTSLGVVMGAAWPDAAEPARKRVPAQGSG